MKGVWFDYIHSYSDLNLVLSKVDIPPATPRTNYVDIPGRDGAVDLTEALGGVKYKDRKGSITFSVFPTDDFEEKKRQVSNLLNGKRFKIRLDKDPDYYWLGRCEFNKYASKKNLHQITMNVTVAPYKFKNDLTTVIIPAGESVVRKLQNGRKSVVPTITTTADAQIIFEGNTYNLGSGIHTILDIELKCGTNQITVTSDSSVKFTYREGDL